MYECICECQQKQQVFCFLQCLLLSARRVLSMHVASLSCMASAERSSGSEGYLHMELPGLVKAAPALSRGAAAQGGRQCGERLCSGQRRQLHPGMPRPPACAPPSPVAHACLIAFASRLPAPTKLAACPWHAGKRNRAARAQLLGARLVVVLGHSRCMTVAGAVHRWAQHPDRQSPPGAIAALGRAKPAPLDVRRASSDEHPAAKVR